MAGKNLTQRLYFRVDEATADRIEAVAAQMNMSRTTLLRTLVKQGLGDPAQLAVLGEAYYALSPVLHRIVSRAVVQINESIPALVAEEYERMGPPPAE